jgi:magnesium transporter
VDLVDPDRDELRARVPRDLHPVALDQLLAPAKHEDEPRPTLEGHGDYAFGVFLAPVSVPEQDLVYYQEVDLVLTEDFVLTVRKTPEHGKPFDISAIQETCRPGAGKVAGMVAYHVVDEVAERYLDLIDAFSGEIDELEDNVETWPAERVRGRLSQLRHDLLHVRQTLSPTRDALRRVIDDRVELEDGELFPHDVELYFADAYDKLLRAAESLDLARDLVAGVRDYVQAKVANDQNEVMKRLTAIASILLVPTLIVGIYGQNFRNIPELHWGFGYAWSWGLIIVTTVFQVVYFRRKRWL